MNYNHISSIFRSFSNVFNLFNKEMNCSQQFIPENYSKNIREMNNVVLKKISFQKLAKKEVVNLALYRLKYS